MEYEVRFYFPSEEYDNIIQKLSKIGDLKKENKRYEKTSQFDHPCDDMSFYTKEIDGRFRIRITKSDDTEKCMISWKRRLHSPSKSEVNREEEVEVSINYSEYDNLMYLINNVLKMKDIESYERYRTIFHNEDVEIAVDEYPFGIALEVENKSETKDPQEVVRKWVSKIGLDIKDAYPLSWDDKYSELCRNQGVKQYSHVTFGLPMPKVINKK